MYEKIMTALTGLGWLAVLIGAAAVPEDAVKVLRLRRWG